MKKILFLSLLLISSTALFSQQIKHLRFSKEEYLKKSKNQKTVASIFLASGGTLILAAVLIPKGKQMTETNGSIWGIPIYSTYYKNEALKETLGGIGILLFLPGIPISLASYKNKRRSMKVSFKNETVPILYKTSLVRQSLPALNLKIRL
ncbi:MAG TPA: hypothetical protein PKC72_01245 [Chitinophagaceae bacterium]|nr:hypothetical protein [Chitinophagaceae bacterium]